MIYQRLTIRTCARYAAVVLPVVTLISGLVFFSRLLGDTAAGKIPAFILGQLFVLTLVKYTPQLLILSAFAGVFIAMRRAFQQREMDAWLSVGLGLHSFIKPTLAFALPIALVVAMFSLYLSPWAANRINVVRAAAAFDIDVDNLPQAQFGSTPSDTHSYFLAGDTLFIASNRRHEVVFARGLHRESATALRLIDGNLFHATPADAAEDGVSTMERMRFGSLQLSIPARDSRNQRPREKSLAALDWQAHPERAEFVWRLALPPAALALALAALYLSPTHSRWGRRFGFLSAIAVFFVTLNSLRFMRDLIAHDTLPAAAAALLPLLLVGALVLLLSRAFQRQ